jgi:hypothetical protein
LGRYIAVILTAILAFAFGFSFGTKQCPELASERARASAIENQLETERLRQNAAAIELWERTFDAVKAANDPDNLEYFCEVTLSEEGWINPSSLQNEPEPSRDPDGAFR